MVILSEIVTDVIVSLSLKASLVITFTGISSPLTLIDEGITTLVDEPQCS